MKSSSDQTEFGLDRFTQTTFHRADHRGRAAEGAGCGVDPLHRKQKVRHETKIFDAESTFTLFFFC